MDSNDVQSFINQIEKSIEEGDFDKYIDVNSFASWLLAHDILGTWDSGGSNLYIMRYDNNSLLEMANMWDFDTIFWMDKDSFSRYHTGNYDFYFPSLFNNSNTSFLHAYINKWNEIKNIIPQQIIDYIKAFADSEEGKALQLSREYYTKRWDKELTTVNEDVEEMINWFSEHLPWLDTTINNMSEQTGISTTYINQNVHFPHIYDIHGKKINTTQKGINIINGKKVLVK